MNFLFGGETRNLWVFRNTQRMSMNSCRYAYTCLSISVCMCAGFPGGSVLKNPPATRGTQLSLGWEGPLEEEMVTDSSILAWRIPWAGEPGGLLSIGLWRVRHVHMCILMCIDRHTYMHVYIYVFIHIMTCIYIFLPLSLKSSLNNARKIVMNTLNTQMILASKYLTSQERMMMFPELRKEKWRL